MKLTRLSSVLASCLLFTAPALAGKLPRIAPLKVLESYTLPTTEISGMAWRRDPKTRAQELVVGGDREHRIYLLNWADRGKELKFRSVDLKAMDPEAAEQSQWESVFSDETGRIFIIQESPARILVVSADLTRIEQKVTLTLAQHGEQNSGGEGVMPLRNGHILVLKEKNPLRILEFVPTGGAAKGYRPEFAIEREGRFPLPAQAPATFTSVREWKFDPDLEGLLEDSSGLNVDRDGTLYLLSDQKNVIARIGKQLRLKSDRLRVSHLWSLPSTLKSPEGMVIDR